jgi:TonB family protein
MKEKSKIRIKETRQCRRGLPFELQEVVTWCNLHEMHRTFLITLLLVLTASTGWAGVAPAAEQMFLDAVRRTHVLVAEAAPLLFESKFSAQIQVPRDGRLTIRWAAKDRYWEHVEADSFQQTRIRKGEMVYTSRNMSFTPARIADLLTLLHGLGNPNGTQIKKERKRAERGVEATCFEVRFDNGRGERSHEICIDPALREVLSDSWNEPPDEQRRVEYSDYAELRGRRYPRKLILFLNGSKVLDVQTARLETADLDDALLVPPPGAIERRECDGIKHPIPVKTPDPIYPRSPSTNRMMGDSMVSMTVLPDGSVDNIQLIGSSTRAMDDATLQTLKRWRFKPAMCGSEPVAFDIEVTVSFRLR